MGRITVLRPKSICTQETSCDLVGRGLTPAVHMTWRTVSTVTSEKQQGFSFLGQFWSAQSTQLPASCRQRSLTQKQVCHFPFHLTPLPSPPVPLPPTHSLSIHMTPQSSDSLLLLSPSTARDSSGGQEKKREIQYFL